jgi:hypothetical protein
VTAEHDEFCESCGKRGLPLVGVDFRDGAEPFVVCVRCASEAVEHGCRQVRLSDVEAS